MDCPKIGAKFTLIYCTLHNYGGIVKGEHLYGLPDGLKFECIISKYCENVDWITVGVISIIDNKIIVNKEIIDIDKKYGSNFKVEHFNVIDCCGQISNLEKNIITNWIKTFNK